MHSWFYVVLIFLWNIDSFQSKTQPNLSSSQLNALHDFYNATNGENWTWRNESITIPWDFDQVNPNPCAEKWQGVTCSCNTVACNLTELSLERYNVTGKLPDSIGEWNSLQSIDLSHNLISGSIPASISYWTQLTNLDFGYNELTNVIPSTIGQLSSIRTLTLSRNRLTYLPDDICNLTTLETLQIDVNRFHQVLPADLGNLQSLEQLEIEFNQFYGHLPISITKCPSLVFLHFSENLFSGSIPEEYGLLSKLIHFEVDKNLLTGTIPSSMGNIFTLERFNIQKNQIFGSFPVSFANLTKLRELFCSYNLLSGSIPANFSNMHELFFIDLGPNSLTGEVTFLSGLRNLSIVYCSNNFFHGNFTFLPVTKFDHMVDFTIFNNEFTGVLPFSTNNNASLVSEYPFFINDTKFYTNSTIYSSLVYYFVENNYFTGNITDDFHYFFSLRYFSVSKNYLSGSIPSYLPNLKFLETMNLSLNALTGTLPAVNVTLKNPKLYQYLVSHNYLTGTIREDFSSYANLIGFSIHHNEFHGTIPRSFGKLLFIEQFFIQNNKLTGSLNKLLNETFSYLHFLRNLDVSNNYFTGYLDEGFFDQSNILETFAAVSNCLTGSIPRSICSLSKLTALALDGLSTSASCRNDFFPTENIFRFNGFLLKDHLSGHIHECLFSLPSLQSLHLSGNSFTGTLPADLNISSSLMDLSLSHNFLSGTIPNVIQERSWSSLDLSYNRFTGTLSSKIASYPYWNTSLNLQVNRLSGGIPNQILTADNINILGGNIFTCDTNSKDDQLPNHDPDIHSYSCGSNVVNNILFTWIAVAFIILSIAFYRKFFASDLFTENTKDSFSYQIRSSSVSSTSSSSASVVAGGAAEAHSSASFSRDSSNHNRSTYFYSIRLARESFVASFTQFIQNHPESNVTLLFTLFKQMSRVLGLLTIYSLLILLPIYVILKLFYKTYEDQYAWIVSGIFLSGITPAIIIFIFLAIFISFLFYLFTKFIFVEIQYHREKIISIRQESLRVQQELLNNLQKQIHLHEQQQQQIPKRKRKSKRKSRIEPIEMFVNTFLGRKLKYSAYFIIILVNLIIFGAVDILYILVSLNYSTAIKTIASISLAGFRIVTNNLVYRKMMPNISKGLIYLIYQILKRITKSEIIDETISIEQRQQQQKRERLENRDENGGILENQHTSYTQAELIDLFDDCLESKQFWSLPYHFENEDIIFLSFLILLNTVVFPVLAIFIILPDCYYNVFYTASSVTSSYSYINCVFYLANGLIERFCEPTFQSTSYLPPFIYSYQCSSKILINYIPVYIMTFILVGFVIPMKNILFKYSHNYLWSRLQEETGGEMTSPSSSSPADADGDAGDDENDEENADDNNNNETNKQKRKDESLTVKRIRWRLRQLERFMSMRLLFPNISATREEILRNTTLHRRSIFFDKVKFSTQISSLLAIVIIYGALFPPLALIGCIAIFVIISYEELMIGKLLFYSLQDKLKYAWIYPQLEKEIQNIHQSLYASIRILLYLPALSFAFILFDIWGNEEGWHTALPISFAFLCIPLILNISYSFYFDQNGQQRSSILTRFNIIARIHSWWNGKDQQDNLNNVQQDSSQTETEMVVIHNPITVPVPITVPSREDGRDDEDDLSSTKQATEKRNPHQNNIHRPLPSLPPLPPA